MARKRLNGWAIIRHDGTTAVHLTYDAKRQARYDMLPGDTLIPCIVMYPSTKSPVYKRKNNAKNK